ncbi:MAG: four helix bundle protein [Acidobacteria bacterium]|nr:four helix bundle protein [Acidobacteriota bacterium]MBA3888251.1 four helix bundle protein [Acidobacteriota bacterium]
MAGKNYRDLIAWQRAMDFAVAVYEATKAFPQEERYGLTSQLRRCSVSIPSNIAEGQGRRNDGHFKHSLQMAHGSLCEAEAQVLLAQRLGFLKAEAADRLLDQAGEVGRLVTGLTKSLEARS